MGNYQNIISLEAMTSLQKYPMKNALNKCVNNPPRGGFLKQSSVKYEKKIPCPILQISPRGAI